VGGASKLAVLIIAWVAQLIACGMYDYKISLPNGYRIIRFNAYELGLFGPEGSTEEIQIAPTIDGYAVVGAIVAGHAEPPHQLPGAAVRAPRTSAEFFVIDTKSAYFWHGTDENEWAAELRTLGVTEPPPLKVPSVWDSFHD